MILINGYAPDADPTTKGIVTDCANLVPSLKGMKGAPAPTALGIDALSAACQGAVVCVKLDDTTRLFAGSGTKLYELSSTSWTDVTRVAGDYNLAADARWSFSQFGNVSLAAAKAEILQSSSAGAFANVGASIPKAAIVETVGQFVFLFDVNDQGALIDSGDYSDRWWCCAKGDVTNWTPSVALECASGRLTSSPGPLKAGKRFGSNIVAYKEKAMFLGTYLGGGPIWDFSEIPGKAGALCQAAVVDVGTPEEPKHIFMGHDDFYTFDGAKTVPIGRDLRETVYGQLNRSYAHLSAGLHDRVNGRVYFYYCSSGTALDRCVVYNYKTDKWGRDDRLIEVPLEYISAGTTYDALGSGFATYNDLPNVSYDSSYWSARTPTPSIFTRSHVLNTLNGTSTSSSLTTGDFGDENISSFVSRVSPRFITKPTTGSLVNYYRMALGDSLNADATSTMDARGRFDFMRDAFWHRFRVDFTGDVELAALNPITMAGSDE